MNSQNQSDNNSQPRHKRRPRYSGTHPRRFEQKYKEHNIEAYPELHEHLLAKGKTPVTTHIPVLIEEVMENLAPKAGEIVADCTVGYGGHAAEFLKRIAPDGKLIAFDVDKAELERTRERLSTENAQVSFYRSNFAGIANVLNKEKIDGYDIIFADLGVSSMQIDNPERGMSYKYDGPLDMRMDDRLKQTAADLLNSLPEKELANAFLELSDEPDNEKVAHMIVTLRDEKPIKTTSQLVDLIFKAKGLNAKSWKQKQLSSKSSSLHPAALVFQALRILVNDEFGSLKELLRLAPYCLRPGGRIGIISFHSGEDRLIKKSFREGVKNGIYQLTVRYVIVPNNNEITINPRSASAKFRWAQKPF
jgi:16S rRNA (cytosine1402-N4)-methyltransferase